jgi:hypothetical protein
MRSGPVAWETQWLGGKDSNLDKQIQSLPSYRWTTPQENERPKGAPLDIETMKDHSTKVKVKTRPMPSARPEVKRHFEGAQRPLRLRSGQAAQSENE